ncbi:hypothetical protein GGR52DRAFT_179813 [Hypoxylon sp. FL1284]|nr:hypothetical protein GGR52DRAFT_179813 [Hypoxylon sp. FL1284]
MGTVSFVLFSFFFLLPPHEDQDFVKRKKKTFLLSKRGGTTWVRVRLIPLIISVPPIEAGTCPPALSEADRPCFFASASMAMMGCDNPLINQRPQRTTTISCKSSSSSECYIHTSAASTALRRCYGWLSLSYLTS